MQIQINLKNLFICLIVIFFVYLAFVIWGSEEQFPELYVELKDLISYVVLAVEMGGHAITKIYTENDLNIMQKSITDVGKAELLTKADLVSNHLILGLLQRFPLIKVITEEKSESLTEKEVEKYRDDNFKIWLNVREALEKFPNKKYNLNRVTLWVDPLDATQEFTEGLTQYVTVMSCIAIDGKPFFGAINRPFVNETIMGMAGFGLLDSNGKRIELKSKTQKNIIISRTHTGNVKELIKNAFKFNEYNIVEAGGAGYKTLQLINGSAEVYLHTTAIKKWDICAGEALIRTSGGVLIDLNGHSLDYSENSPEVHKGGFLLSFHKPLSFLTRIKNYLHKN